MAITINTQTIHASIAAVLKEIDAEANIFDNPNQQGTPYPAWFIVHRSPVEIQKEIGRYVLVYQIDIWYMLKQNITRLYDQYSSVAEQLDDKLEYLPIYGTNNALVHVYDRSWGLELNALKYSITLRLRVSRDKTPDVYMQVIEDLQTFIKTKLALLKVYFTNTEHGDLGVEIPSRMFCYYGDTFELPVVEGIYRDSDNHRWEPVGWTAGAFGETIGPLFENVTTNLIMERVIGYDAVIGGTVGLGTNTGSETVLRIKQSSLDREPDYRFAKGISSFVPVGCGTVSIDA